MLSENKKREEVESGKFVAYSYKLYNETGGLPLLFEAEEKAPDVMVYGVSQEIVPGLAATLKGLAKGDKFSVTLPPEAAFGHRSPEYEISLDPEIFMRGGEMAEEVKVGALLPMMTAEGFRIEGKVIEIADKIKMDFNHPFAGMTVRYEGKVEEVRNATPDGCSSPLTDVADAEVAEVKGAARAAVAEEVAATPADAIDNRRTQ